jgi:hypothetical protein
MDSGRDPFEGPLDTQGAFEEMYGLGGLEGDTGRVVARSTDIYSIWADRRQPRRAIPATIGLHWDGNPEQVAELLGDWQLAAQTKYEAWAAEPGRNAPEITLDVVALITGQSGVTVPEDAPAIFREYIELVSLAQSIAQIGLTNHITVIEQSDRLLIETGERRWLAHHLLATYYDANAFGVIRAVLSDGRDSVWKQADENMERSPLNAIGMARQLALLIMQARIEAGDNGRYDDFNDLVLPGGCDRRFYAQVANGNVHKVPRGQALRIQRTMRLGESQLSHYRKLLRLFEDDDAVNDRLWTRADVEDWAEGHLRRIAVLPLYELQRQLTKRDWQLADLLNLADTFTPVKVQAPEVGIGAGNGLDGVGVETLTPSPSPSGRGEQNSDESPVFVVGEAVERVHTGEAGEVIEVVPDGRVQVRIDEDEDWYEPEALISLGCTWDEYVAQEFEAGVMVEGDWEEEDEDAVIDAAVTDPETLYPVSPSDDPLVERARQIALDNIGESLAYLERRIRGRTGIGGKEVEVNFGGGAVILNYGTANQRRLNYSREQVAVVLDLGGKGLNGGDRLFRFHARNLMQWKLSNMPSPPAPLPQGEGRQTHRVF